MESLNVLHVSLICLVESIGITVGSTQSFLAATYIYENVKVIAGAVALK